MRRLVVTAFLFLASGAALASPALAGHNACC